MAAVLSSIAAMALYDGVISGEGDATFSQNQITIMHVEVLTITNPEVGIIGTVPPRRLVRAGWIGLGYTLSEYVSLPNVVHQSVFIDCEHQSFKPWPDYYGFGYVKWILPWGVTAHLWIDT